MKRVPISYYDVQDHPSRYNTHNLHEYDPYTFEQSSNTLHVDETWWNSLTFSQTLLQQRLKPLVVKIDSARKIDTPHAYEKSAAELVAYRTNLDMHDFQHWFDAVKEKNLPDLQGVHLIKVSLEERRLLASLTRKRIREAKDIEETDKKSIETLLAKISLVFSKSDIPYFLRLSGTSGKNEVPVEPVYNTDDVLKRLTCNILFLHQEYEREEKETFIVLRPWNDRIEKKNEFRVFVYEGKITGISQQHWQQLFCYSDEELDCVERAVLSADFLQDAPYANFVADVWISFDDSQCHLIEYNPFGAHCGAGSSLFEWQRDFEVLYGKNHEKMPELRFSSLLLYA